MKTSMLKYYQEIKCNRIILVFKGALTQEILGEFGALVRSRFSADSEFRAVNRLFSVLIEMCQNMLHYSAEREVVPYLDRETGVGLIMVRDDAQSFVITSGNLVRRDREADLSEKCSFVNSLDKEALKQLYLRQRRQQPGPESKGAGLGLIDMARKSSRPLYCVIEPVSDEHAFFSLTVTVDKND